MVKKDLAEWRKMFNFAFAKRYESEEIYNSPIGTYSLSGHNGEVGEWLKPPVC